MNTINITLKNTKASQFILILIQISITREKKLVPLFKIIKEKRMNQEILIQIKMLINFKKIRFKN